LIVVVCLMWPPSLLEARNSTNVSAPQG